MSFLVLGFVSNRTILKNESKLKKVGSNKKIISFANVKLMVTILFLKTLKIQQKLTICNQGNKGQF